MTKNKPVFNLTPEELEIEAEFKSGKVESVPATAADSAHWSAMARYTLEKTKAISISESLRKIS